MKKQKNKNLSSQTKQKNPTKLSSTRVLFFVHFEKKCPSIYLVSIQNLKKN